MYYSEINYYKKTNETPAEVVLTSLTNNEEVGLSHEYVKEFLKSASEFTTTQKVGVLDKLWTAKQIAEEVEKDPNFSARVGDLRIKGIKTIWSEIGTHCFTVTYQKKGKELSDSAYKKLVDKMSTEAISQIEQVKTSKKGVTKTATEIIKDLLVNPPSKFEQGEMRTLVGRKIQFESADGLYSVQDFEAADGQPRSVNVNTITEIIYLGVKYIKE
jgi:hypothetical protein